MFCGVVSAKWTRLIAVIIMALFTALCVYLNICLCDHKIRRKPDLTEFCLLPYPPTQQQQLTPPDSRVFKRMNAMTC